MRSLDTLFISTIGKMKLLLVEDEIELANSIYDFLSKEGDLCEVANNYTSAIEKVNLYQYDLLILDIGLPDGSGLDIIKNLKKNNSKSGIIVISARDSVEQKIAGLALGADDYLSKPFHLSELNARIRSLIRRVNFEGSNTLIMNELTVIMDEHKVFVSEKTVELTKREFDLLLYLLANKNRVLTKLSIGEHLWGDFMDSADSSDFVYTHIKNLRKKLLKAGAKDYIKNIYAVGYKFTVDL